MATDDLSNGSAEAAEALRLQWVGDISLNGLYCDPQHHADLRRNLEQISHRLGPCDLRIGNWESPLWGDGGVNLHKQPRLCTSLDAARAALPLGLHVALLANNHLYDCLERGFENTTAFFNESGICWLGAGRNAAEASRPLVLERRGCRLGLLNYVDADTHPNIPAGAGLAANMLEPDRVLDEVAALARQVDVVLLNLHWGVDLIGYPTIEHRRLARRAIEAGACVVAGHHAHCIQSHEPWQNGHIFYGLGELLFDEVDRAHLAPDVSRRGAIAACTVREGRVTEARLHHVYRRGLFLEWDDRSRRRRQELRLNRPLAWGDDRYHRHFRRARYYQALVFKPCRFIRDAGGLLPAVARIRWRHLSRLSQLLRRRSR